MWVVVWLVCGIIAASIAQSKGYSGCLWAIIGFLLGPLAVVCIGLMGRKMSEPDVHGDSATHRLCPYCSEPIKREAVKCRHCGSEVTPPG